MVDRILHAIEDLSRFPRMGPVVPDVKLKGIELRERVVHPYRVIYRIKDNHLVVIAIIHGARLLGKSLRGRRMS